MSEIKKSVKTIQSVHRALDILEFLVGSGDGQKLSLITEHCGLNKTTAFHIIKTLESRGYLEQSPDSLRYKTGGKLFEIAMSAYRNINLNQICQPHLEQLLDRFNETAGVYHYTKVDGVMRALCIHYMESTHPVKVSLSIGRRLPLFCTAVGRMYLSALKGELLKQTLISESMEHFTDATTTDRDTLCRKLKEARGESYCIEREEYEEGVVNVAVPIYKYSGRVIASICITIPAQRAEQGRLEEMVSAMKPISRELSSLPL